MNQFDNKHWRFPRVDPTPNIPFNENTTRGIHAVFWFGVAIATVLVAVL
jgi:hypothetical protein